MSGHTGWNMRASLLGLLIAAALSGCASLPTAEQGQSAYAEDYASARQALETKRWPQAAQQLEALVKAAPKGRYEAQALLDLAYVYYQQGDYDKARQRADTFITEYRDHAKVAYAYYMRGLALDRSAQRELEQRLASQAPTPYPTEARRAFEAFAALVQRFPQSPYSEDSIARMRELRRGLARYELHRAAQQLARGEVEDAVKRTQYVIDRYSGSGVQPEALALLVRAYRAQGKTQQAQEALLSLETTYPDAPQLRQLQQRSPAR